MNDNDVADQLRLVYRLQRFQRNYKWWWALWMWGLEVSMVNAYMMYRRYMELSGRKVEWTHEGFQEAIGYAFIDPDGMWPRRKSGSPPPAPSTPRKFIKVQKPRAPKLTLKALSPTRGVLNKRLNETLPHLPVFPSAKKDNRVCQLHRWAYNQKTGSHDIPPGARTGVLQCKVCTVNLCVPCFSIWHESRKMRPQIDVILANDK